jgi:oligopeptide/dipeptide ABC transporter ATP-binding protein
VTGVLRVENVAVSLCRGQALVPVLDQLDLGVKRGEMLALVGESGSGKTIAAMAMMRLLPRGARMTGEIWLDGIDLQRLDEAGMRRVRGREIGMVFQNPLAALNPSRSIGVQIEEAWRVHRQGSRSSARRRALDLLGEVGIPNPSARIDDYPHQFSGGMRQRVMIATALACDPKLLIADEPTTGLDPLIARQIMALIARLQHEHAMGVLFITHDFSVVEAYADGVQVLYAGRTVERGPARRFFLHPRHPYSEALLSAIPRLGLEKLQNIPGALPEPETRPPGCRFAPRCVRRQPECEHAYPAETHSGDTAAACLFPLSGNLLAPEPVISRRVAAPPRQALLEISGLTVRYQGKNRLRRREDFTALRDVSLRLGRGECLGVVGESGSGKSTLGRAILQMQRYRGSITLEGHEFSRLRSGERRRLRRKIQVVFQDPRESLNPRLRVADAIAEPIVLMHLSRKADIPAMVTELLLRVGLNPKIGEQYPANISGGQAQRVAIARALAAQPDIIVLDEPTSALDVSTQAMLLNLLKDLSREKALSYILISHDFAVVSYMADRIVVLKAGQIVEMADSAAIIASPQNAYTKALVAAAPQLQILKTEFQGGTAHAETRF